MIVAEIFDGPWIDGFIPDQALDAEVTVQLYARNAIAPVRWEVLTDPGELPADFAIDAATGVVTFTADEAGAFSVSIRVTDSEPCQTSSTFTWRVELLPLEVTGTIPDMTVGTPVTGTLTMSGGVEPRSLSGYTLPAGVTLTKTNETTLTFGGTPTGAGLGPGTSFAFDASVDIAGSASGSAVLSDSITLTVTAVVAAFDPTPLLDCTVGTPYTAQVDASGGIPPYSYAVTTGALPAGLSLNASTGEITGTPTTAATGVSFTVTVTDSEGNFDDVTDTIDVFSAGLEDAIMALSPWAYYKLDEAPMATSFSDSSGNGRHLTNVSGSPTAGSTSLVPPDTSVEFNGSTGAIFSGNNEFGTAAQTAFHGDVDLAMIAVIDYDETTPGNVFHVGTTSVSGSQGFLLGVSMSGANLRVSWAVMSSGGFVILAHTFTGVPTMPIMIGGRRSNANNNTALFVNGSKLQENAPNASINVQCAATASGNGNRITIGRNNGGAGGGTSNNYFDGKAQHAAIFAGALSDADFATIASAGGF